MMVSTPVPKDDAWAGIGVILRAKNPRGEPVWMVYVNKGTSAPYFDEHGNRSAAYTSWFRFGPAGAPETYVQVRRSAMEENPGAMRAEENRVLTAFGVDPDSVEWPDQQWVR